MPRDGSALVDGSTLAARPPGRSRPILDPEPPAMAGRGTELETLRWAWRRAVAGEGRMITVAGEPGIGKTRLTTEVLHRIGADRAWVVGAQCDNPAPTPYGPVLEALARCRPAIPADLAGGSPDGDGHPLVWLAGTEHAGAPAVWQRLTAGDLMEEPADPVAARHRVLGAATRLFSGMAATAPVLLVVDDLEMADESTLVLVRHLAALASTIRMLVIGTYSDASVDRADPLFGFLRQIAAETSHDRLVLAGLDRREVRSMVGNPERGDMLWAASEGNPLCIRLLAALEGGDRPTDRPTDSAALPAGRLDIPAGVQDTVDAWLARLDDGTRRWLVAAAVIGPSFDLDLLALAAHVRHERVEAAMAGAAGAGVVEADPRAAGTAANRYLRFTHSLFQRSLYRNLTPSQLVRLHGHVAEALERHPSPTNAYRAQLAFHLGRAAPVGRSVTVLRHFAAMGDHAMSVGGYEDAARYYGRALAAAGIGAPAAERADLLLALGGAHRRSGDELRARTTLLEAASAARGDHDGERLAAAALDLARLAPVWGGDGVIVRLLEEALTALESRPATPSPHGATMEATTAAVRSSLAEVGRRKD